MSPSAPCEPPDQPCVIPVGTGGAASETVSYRGRFLYSKYNPARAITATIEGLSLLPGTLVVMHSPALWHGLDALARRLPDGCTLLAVEAEPALHELARRSLRQKAPQPAPTLFLLDDLAALDQAVRDLVHGGTVRRMLALDFSGGTQFAAPLYARVDAAIQEIITAFWKNRITLVTLGRLFAKNTLRNLGNLVHDRRLSDVQKTVSRPIIVCGAGEGLDRLFSAENRALRQAVQERRVYLLAVDAAAAALRARGIVPDAIAGVEAQFAIQKAYLGATGGGRASVFFADLCSRPEIPGIVGGSTVWFASEYAESAFLAALRSGGIITDFLPPLGSVGLTATAIALALRTDAHVPVYTAGLDFSYSAGCTHARGTPAHRTTLSCCDRLSPPGRCDAAFAPGVRAVRGKDGATRYASPNLLLYAESFARYFASVPNLFDAGTGGLPLGIPAATKEDICAAARTAARAPAPQEAAALPHGHEPEIRAFYEQEAQALRQLADLLSHGEAAASRTSSMPLEAQMRALLLPRDYLYLHFPDGVAPSMEPSFLKRVRAEIDFFLKQMALAQP